MLEEEKITQFEEKEIQEILDDGVTVIDLKSSKKDINGFFNEKVCEEKDIGCIIGYKIEKNGEKVISEPITVAAVNKNGKIIEKSGEYKEIIEDVSLVEEDYDVLLQKTSSDCLERLSKKEIAFLQATNSIGNSYAETSRTTYFYADTTWFSNKTKTLKKGMASGDGWRKMGFSTLMLSAYNVGGKGAKRYDLFMGIIQAGGLGGYTLSFFNGQMRVFNQNNCSIVDISHLKGDSNESITASIGAGIGASEAGLSANISAGYSYSYNPNGMEIHNKSGQSELIPIWNCVKRGALPNERYVIKPSIIVKSPQGKTKNTKVAMRVKGLRFSGDYQTYDVDNSSGSEYVSLTVCNHKKV